MSGAMSGAQLGALLKSRTQSSSLYSNPAQQDDEHTLGAGSSGGWEGELSLNPLTTNNLSTAQQPMAWRSPFSAIGKNTIGTLLGQGPAWHERYKSD